LLTNSKHVAGVRRVQCKKRGGSRRKRTDGSDSKGGGGRLPLKRNLGKNRGKKGILVLREKRVGGKNLIPQEQKKSHFLGGKKVFIK